MSKFVNKMKTIVEGGGRSLGFRPGMAAVKQETMLLVVYMPSVEDKIISDISKSRIDGLIINRSSIEKSQPDLKHFNEALGGVPCGCILEKINRETMENLEEKGYDFVIFDAQSAGIKFLETKTLGRIVKADLSWEDSLTVSLNELPVDGLYITQEAAGPLLNLAGAMEYQRVVNLVRKPFLANIPWSYDKEDIRGLWQIGCCGIVVEAGVKFPVEQLQEYRKLIDTLPPFSKRRRTKGQAILPAVEVAEVAEEEEE